MLIRTIETDINRYLQSKTHEILFVWGPRRSGKTTLLQKLSKRLKTPIFNFDYLSDREIFTPTREALGKIAADHKIILIDEAQNYPEATIPLKILHDEFKIKIIATGSSELRRKSQEFDSLADRYSELYCLPLTAREARENKKIKSYEEENFLRQLSEHFQIYGAYPKVYLSPENQKPRLLQKILESYVLKDIVDIYDLKNAKLAKDMLTKIALQIGSEVSLRELADSLGTNAVTISNYIEIFIKNYVLIPLPAFRTNARRAIGQNRKIYFYDLGIRNALVQDFRPLSLRPDAGGLFENFIIAETEKLRRVNNLQWNLYFYREYGGKEVDLVLENYQKQYRCWEIKTTQEKAEKIFPFPHHLSVVNGKNYFDNLSSLNNQHF